MGPLDDLVPDLEGFDWDTGNAAKNWLRHAVRQAEAEQALLNTPLVVAADIRHSGAEPRFIALENNLAILYMMRGDTSKAVAHYQALLQKHPTLSDVWLNLGVVYAKAGKFAAARKAWENTLKYSPNDSTAKAYLAKLPGRS